MKLRGGILPDNLGRGFPVSIEAFGSSSISTQGKTNLAPIFEENAARGCAAMLLGHDPGNASRGACFNIGPSGEHKGHALTFGRTRGGKGVSSIIPALLTYAGSMVVIDPKGENAWITAARRRAMGHRTVILDPWNEVNRRFGEKIGVVETITRFNPFSALNPADQDFADDIAAIAEALIMQTGNDPHWPDSARELTAGLIAAEIQDKGNRASARSIRKLLTAPIDVLRCAIDIIMQEFPGSVAANKLSSFAEADSNTKEIGSVRSTARTQTAFLDSNRLLESMETDDEPFNLGDLATSKVTLYLVLPVDRLRTHGRWLRLILTLAIRAISKAKDSPKFPVTFILDELGTISPGSGLSMVEQSYGLMAGLGIRIWAFLQDLPQLQRDYRHSWETFISNSSVIQLLNVADNTTAKYFSDYLGNSTINAKNGSWSLREKRHNPGTSFEQEWLDQATRNCMERGYVHGTWEQARSEVWQHATGKKGMHTSTKITTLVDNVKKHLQERGQSELGKKEWTEDTQLMSRPVMFPWEIVNADPTNCILIMPGLYNLQLKRFIYYSDPHLSKWARRDPNRAS